ncbi:carbohydrate ABC transporter permease [Anaerocolumna xylanovorans]|uniref:Putative aldouronate transport system permease protein n=1 Tax=Anaerocolumna xylanovorans DSM 12503 TaxID=1121345 RepID=A0A1M7YKV3_9FIRM|nr:carbohydrate ABC transporter permease [Anaerocolumna xylanovorans]SHO53243.1 putative aldouronate transport system permease protein [Anaerocolumna xylanovorans DSM 12503]
MVIKMKIRTKKHRLMKLSKGDRIFQICNGLIMLILCIVIVYPLYYVVIASVTDPVIVNSGKPLLYPVKVYLKGYITTLNYMPLWTAYKNTILYTVAGTIVALIATVPAGYALSRKDLAGRRGLIFLFTFTMFFNGGIIPLYLTIRNLGIYNTIWAMVLPVAVSAYNLIVCRSFFSSGLPDELLEAAKMDGCSDFGFFFRIAIPLSKTIIAVMCLFYATAMWNQFFNALMYLQDDSKMPLQVVLRNLVLMNQANQMGSSGDAMVTKQKLAEQLKYCIVVVSAAPLLMAYPFLQKYFAKGVTIGAVKG